MGFIENALKKAIRKKINQHFKPVPKNKPTSSQKRDALLMREIRQKQKLADDIRTEARLQAQRHLKIIKDCEELVNTTVKPDVFFNRYALMLEQLETLTGFESTGIFAKSPELPTEAFLRIEARFNAATNDFLDRSFENAKKHAETLKTDSGKRNAIKRYFENMEKYIIYMSGESLEYFDKMKEANNITQ